MFFEDDDYRNRYFSLQGISKREAEDRMKNTRKQVKNMQNRLKVLSSHTEYISSRLEQRTQKIDKHYQIHQQINKQKKKVADSLSSWKAEGTSKQAHKKVKQELEEKLKKAIESLKKEKAVQGQQVKQSSVKRQQFLAHRNLKLIEQKRTKRAEVLKAQEKVRYTLSRYAKQKRADINAIKYLQKSHYLQQSLEFQRELQDLTNKQKEIVYFNSQSLRDFGVVDHHLNELYSNKKGNRYLQLPSIRLQTEKSTTEMS